MQAAVPILNSMAGMVVFGGIGFVCVMHARLIQRWAIERYQREGRFGSLNPFREFVKTEGYILSVRATGVLAGVVAVMCAYALAANLLALR